LARLASEALRLAMLAITNVVAWLPTSEASHGTARAAVATYSAHELGKHRSVSLNPPRPP